MADQSGTAEAIATNGYAVAVSILKKMHEKGLISDADLHEIVRYAASQAKDEEGAVDLLRKRFPFSGI